MREGDIKLLQAADDTERLIKIGASGRRTDEELARALISTLDDLERLVRFARTVYAATEITFDLDY